MNAQPATTPNRGFSLVEVMVALSLLGVVMMSLAGAATLALSQMTNARQDLQYSADVQQVADSLVAVGWNNVTTGSSNMRGRPINWTVATLNPNSQKLTVVVQRRGQASTSTVYSDTVMLYLAKPQVQ
jgi:prepilin-type N-terminal cleavage/methylation domain-containing protein